MYLNVSECSGNGKLYVFFGVINWLAFQKLGIWNMKKKENEERLKMEMYNSIYYFHTVI